MKTRRLFSLIAATCALVLSTATFAQPAAGPKPRERVQMTAAELRERRMKQLDDRLQLSGEQKTKIHAIWDSAAEQLKAIQGCIHSCLATSRSVCAHSPSKPASRSG